MPPNSHDNLIPLEIFRRRLSYHPWHFWQLAGPKVPLTSSSITLLREHAWQMGNSAGREDIRLAIQRAENNLRKYLNYDVSPKYRTEEIPITDQLLGQNGFSPLGNSFGYGYRSYNYHHSPSAPGLMLTTDVVKIRRIGTVAYQEIGSATLTFHDPDGDGLKEVFRAEYTGDTTSDATNVVAAISEADRAYSPETESDVSQWVIRPCKVTRFAPDTLRVQGATWLLTKPVLYEGVKTAPGYDGSTGIDSSGSYDPNAITSPFVAEITLYKKIWTDENKCSLAIYSSDGTLQQTYPIPTFFPDSRDRDLGYVYLDWRGLEPGLRCHATGAKGIITLSYEAGGNLPDWETCVIRLACSELRKMIAGSKEANTETAWWQRNLAQTVQGENGYRILDEDLRSPWGTFAGSIEAWRAVRDFSVQRALGGL